MRMLPRMVAIIAASGVALAAWAARAEEPEIITVRSTDCRDLRVDELQRVLNVELAPAPGDTRPNRLSLRVRCVDDRIELFVLDPRTGKDLKRTIPAPPRNEPGRERIIALAVSELFASAWLDLLSAPQPTRVEPEPPAPDVAPPTTAPAVAPAASEPARRDAITIGVALGVRRVQTPIPTGALALGYGGWLRPRWGLFGALAVEYGGRPTPLGSVHALVVGPHLRGAFRSRARGRIRLLASAGIGLRYLRLHGFPSRPAVQGGSAHALAADGFATLGIAIDLRRGFVEIPIVGGFLGPGPRGRVTGRDPVRADGGFIGIAPMFAITP